MPIDRFVFKLPYFVSLILCALLMGCTTSYPNKNPVGETFPSVKGENLEKRYINLPADLANEPSVLLLGFVQNAQFDIDRWLIGLDMTKTKVDVYEVPTMQGMFPKFFKTQINEGMRKGIPKSLWKGVITVYDDGEMLQKFTGNMNPNNARVILLDDSGTVNYFYYDGFSVDALNKLKQNLQSLKDD